MLKSSFLLFGVFNNMVVRRNFSRGQSRQFSYLFQVTVDAVQMDVNKTLYPFYTAKKLPHITATVAKNALCWQQWYFFTHNYFLFTPYTVQLRGLLLQYQQSLSRCINFQRCVRWTVTCVKTRTAVTWRQPLNLLSCYCYAIRTNSGTIRSQVSHPASASKGADLVNRKLITAWHQNSEPSSCAVWVSHRQINCHCKN